MSNIFNQPLSMPALSGFYMKAGLLMTLQATLEERGVKDIDRYFITVDETSVMISPGEDVPNWPQAVFRIYKRRHPSVLNGDLVFRQFGITADTVGVYENEFLDNYGLRDLETGYGSEMTLLNTYLAISEFGQLSLVPCIGNWLKDKDLTALLASIPSELMDNFQKSRVKSLYEKFYYKEELTEEEKKAMTGVDNAYHNWLYFNGCLAARMVSVRQEQQAAMELAEERRQKALLTTPTATDYQERMDAALAAGDTAAAEAIVLEAQEVQEKIKAEAGDAGKPVDFATVAKEASAPNLKTLPPATSERPPFAWEITAGPVIEIPPAEPKPIDGSVVELVDVEHPAEDQGRVAGQFHSADDATILANIAALQADAEARGEAPEPIGIERIEQGLSEHNRDMDDLAVGNLGKHAQ